MKHLIVVITDALNIKNEDGQNEHTPPYSPNWSILLTLIPMGGGGFCPTNQLSSNCYQSKNAGFIKIFDFY